jgi:hypothetical protein
VTALPFTILLAAPLRFLGALLDVGFYKRDDLLGGKAGS